MPSAPPVDHDGVLGAAPGGCPGSPSAWEAPCLRLRVSAGIRPDFPRVGARSSEHGRAGRVKLQRMDVDLPAEDDPRRLEVRAWFASNPNPSPRELVDAGFVVPHWPRPYGLDADPALQLIIEDEIRRAGVSRPVNPIGIGHCGPILVALGNEEQKHRYLWPMLTAEENGALLRIEPRASDKTRF